jgi:DNA-binding beta-propeller fold protein YncE
MIHLTATTKIIASAVALSLGWIVLEACDCNQSKEDAFPGLWVSCLNNMPTLMTYAGDDPIVVTTKPATGFNPSDYDCSRDATSPQYKGSESSAPFQTSTPAGPEPGLRPRVTQAGNPYLPEQVRDLPFTPPVPPATTAACQSNFPDVFRTNHNENSVTRISTCPFAIKTTIPVFANPLQVAVTPDGSTALVTSFGSLDGSGGAVSLVSLSTNKVTSTVMMPFQVTPNGLAISPDSTTAYIGNFTVPGQILVMNIASQMITATIQNLVQYPSGLTLTPDGSELWVASPLGTEVDVIDTLSQTEIFRLNIQDTTDIAFNSTGTTAYITSSSTNPGQVMAVNTATFQVMNTYTVGNTPSDISMSYGDRFLVVNNENDVIISVIDLVQNAVKSVTVGSQARGIAFVQ